MVFQWLFGLFISVLLVGTNCIDRVLFLNESNGLLSDGPKNYSSNEHLEWLISGEQLFV